MQLLLSPSCGVVLTLFLSSDLLKQKEKTDNNKHGP